jgi:hypothetical protein
VKAQEPVECEIVETDWEKTANSAVENTYNGPDLLLGETAFDIDDPDWQWTDEVWDGPQNDPQWEEDHWADWEHEGEDVNELTHKWFKTSLELPGCFASIRLVNKYDNSILSINDNLYVYVNGQFAIGGGNARTSLVFPDFDPLFDFLDAEKDEFLGIAEETDGWYILDGLELPIELFESDFPNEITILTEDYEGSGGLGHVVFCVEEIPCSGIAIDIKPHSCPNPLNVKSKGVLPVAVLGTEDFDVYEIDVASIELEGVRPIRSDYEDVATPFDGELCDCHELGADGFEDLTLKFEKQEIVSAIEPVSDREELVLTLTGELFDGTPIEGQDCVVIIRRGKER